MAGIPRRQFALRFRDTDGANPTLLAQWVGRHNANGNFGWKADIGLLIRARACPQLWECDMIRWFALFAAGLIRVLAPAWAKIEQFPAIFTTREIPVDGATIHMRVGGQRPGGRAAPWLWRHRRHVGAARGRAGARPHRRRARPARHGPLGIPTAATTRRARRRISPACSSAGYRQADARHARHRQHGGLCLRRRDPRQVTRWVVMDAPLPGLGHWDDVLKGRKPGISTSMGPMRNGWSPAASAFTSTASTMSSPRTPRRSTRKHASTTRRSIHVQRRSTTRSRSSRLSARTRRTTRNSSPTASSPCPCWRSAARIRSERPLQTRSSSRLATSARSASPIPVTG